MQSTDYAQEYAKLKLKYPYLPEYSIYDDYVEVAFLSYDIYDTRLMARFFRRLLERRLESMIGFFQGILFPHNQSLIAMEESSFFSEDEKHQLSEVMRKCMILYRTCSALNFSYKEVEECQKISEVMNLLIENQQFIDNILEKIKKEWAKKAENRKASSYLG